MSLKLSKRLSSKKKKPPKDNAQAGVLHKLGLEAFGTTPLEPASILDISTWTLENQAPQEPKDLPNAFLKRLWLLSPDARSPCCKPVHEYVPNNAKKTEEIINGCGGESSCEINPLDLVTAVFMSSNTFLQQEITVRMVQCQFAVPLVLPNVNPVEPSRFLLWPLRGVFSQWRSILPVENRAVQEGNLASTHMPMISCVKLGHCGVSKSLVLNNVISGLRPPSETFLHRGMDGGQLPQRLSNGLVEIGWYLPTGDKSRDIFPVPVVISNLRGDASTHEKNLSFLCQASSAVVIFCGRLREREKQLIASCKDMASKLILIDLSDTENTEKPHRVVGFVDDNLEEAIGLPRGSVLQGSLLSEKDLASRLCDTLKDIIPDKVKLVTLEAAAHLAEELGIDVDEGAVCKKAMATVEDLLKGLDEGSFQFREKQLPLQGILWSKLSTIGKEEIKQMKKGKEIDPQLQKEKKDILVALSSYKMTPAMKIFIDALSTTDKVERTCFLSWIKLKLQLMQTEIQNRSQDLFTNLQMKNNNGKPEYSDTPKDVAEVNLGDSDSFCTDPTFEEEETESAHNLVKEQQLCKTSNEKEIHDEDIIENNVCFKEQTSDSVSEAQNHNLEGKQQDKPELRLPESDFNYFAEPQISPLVSFEHDSSSLVLEHFLREMGLIFELTHIGPGSGSHNVLRLPSLATDLLLCGIPLELMDGDASNIPIQWLGFVFAELKRRLPQEHCRTRVLTNLGVHNARNADVLTALFGVQFPERRKISTRGVYMVILCLPENLRKEMECDFLLIIDVEGLCSVSLDNNKNTLIHDNEMATLATGLSDVLMQNISSNTGSEFDANFTVIVNALLRVKECGSIPICQILAPDEGINNVLKASELRRVSEILQTGDIGTSNADKLDNTTNSVNCVKGLCHNMSLSGPIDTEYSEAVLKLKQNLFGALKRSAVKSEATGLPEFMSRLCAVWDAVRAESFSIGLQNTDIASAFSLLCTELSQLQDSFLENMESWLVGATKKIVATNAKTLDTTTQNDPLSDLKEEAEEEVKTEVGKLRSEIEANLMKDNLLKMSKFKPILMSNMDDLQERVSKETIQRLEALKERHCSSTQLKMFETLLEKEKESKLHALVETSKSTKVLFQDTELEEEFEGMWSKTLSNFDFRPSETEDITARVTDILKENLISRGLQKHVEKLEVISQNQSSSFQVYDEHFGYRSRLKHMFEDNNRQQRLEAQQLAYNVIEEYNQFVAHKSSLTADFSDSYITELLEIVEKALKEKSLEIRSAFEADLKSYLCSAACQDFQKLHDRYAKDKELLTCITATKSNYLAEFIYEFRKRDQCQRVAQAFTSMVLRPTVVDYIYRPLGMCIVDEIKGQAQQYDSPRAFHQSLLEDLIKEDCFQSLLEYLLSYDNFRLRKVREAVEAHLFESTNLDKLRQQRLGEIVGQIAAAVSQTEEGTNGVLSDTKPLLERVCFTLERDGDVDVPWASLDGPLFSITTEWDRFVTCLMELLAAMRLELSQEISQKVEITQILQCVSIQPQDYIFKKVKGCDKQCPLCRAPCDLEEKGHEVHRALIHRPKDMLPLDSCSLSCISRPESIAKGNPGQNKDTHDITVACRDLHSLFPDWSSPEDSNGQMSNVYWRHVLARFNDRFSKQYKLEPAKIPDEWKIITEEEALYSLKEAFLTGQCWY